MTKRTLLLAFVAGLAALIGAAGLFAPDAVHAAWHAALAHGELVLALGPVAVTRDMPTLLREASIVPASFDAADNSVEVRWTTGARVRRYDWYNDTVYEEELVVEPGAVDMSRFDAGTLQVLDGHRAWGGVAAILGVATRGTIANGEGTARLALSRDPAKAGIVADIQAGIIRAISFGYSVEQYEITPPKARTDGGKLPLYRALRWQPSEISFVPVPADAQASTREQFDRLVRSAGSAPCEFITRAAAHTPQQEQSMTEKVRNDQGGESATPAPQADVAAERQAATAAERRRAADVTALCQRHGISAERQATFITEGASVDAVRAAILDELATRSAAPGDAARNVVRTETVADETETRLLGMEEAIQHRVNPRAELTDNGRQYRGMSLLEIGREHLERAGVRTRGLSRMQLATAILSYRSVTRDAPGMLSTSDFANLLANVSNKRLRQAYVENVPSYQRWARRAPNAPDFKAMSVVQLGGAPDLLQVNEAGEFTYGALTDGKETYSMLTFGRIVNFSRQALINDDLRGFDRLVGAFGGSAARLENRTVYAILTANAALSDAVALFHATHANLAGTGGAINVTTLGAGRAAMRVQKGLQDEELNIAPRYLIVPAALEQVAYQYTSSNYVPQQPGNVNEFRAGGRTAVEPIVEAVLDGNSATAWYLAADSAQVDTVEFCYLDGAEGPMIESEVGFEVDGLSLKARLDFAAKAIDYRGLYKNAGA